MLRSCNNHKNHSIRLKLSMHKFISYTELALSSKVDLSSTISESGANCGLDLAKLSIDSGNLLMGGRVEILLSGCIITSGAVCDRETFFRRETHFFIIKSEPESIA